MNLLPQVLGRQGRAGEGAGAGSRGGSRRQEQEAGAAIAFVKRS